MSCLTRTDSILTVGTPLTESPSDGTKVAYFRGRKLYGKAVKLPEGYRGVVVQQGDVNTPAIQQPPEVEVADLENEGEEPAPTGTLETKAEFEEMVVWGHEAVADATSDPYARSMEEWLTVADQVTSSVTYLALSYSISIYVWPVVFIFGVY